MSWMGSVMLPHWEKQFIVQHHNKDPQKIMQSIYGIHAVSALIQNNPSQINTLLMSANRQDHVLSVIAHAAKEKKVTMRFAEKKELDAYGKNHQGVVALLDLNAKSEKREPSLKELIELSMSQNRLILALDSITDPHNLGACIRSAEALGCDGVLIPADRSAQVSAIVHKTSSGASQIIPIVNITNLSQSLKALKEAGFWLTGLSGDEDTALTEIDFSLPTVIVMGSEGSGMRRLTKENCDFLAKIPMSGHTESLNVSVACGIALFEVSRQRSGL